MQSLTREVVVAELQRETLRRVELHSRGPSVAMEAIDRLQFGSSSGSSSITSEPDGSFAELGGDWDLATHLCLRLACACASARDQGYIRRWFINCETALFRLRLTRWVDAGAPVAQSFAPRSHEWWRNTFGGEYPIVDASSLPKGARTWLDFQRARLADASGGRSVSGGPARMVYYRVPVGRALGLVRRRAVIVDAGHALIPVVVAPGAPGYQQGGTDRYIADGGNQFMLAVVTERFRSHLSSRLSLLGNGAAARLGAKDRRFQEMFGIVLEAAALDADPSGDQNEVVAFRSLLQNDQQQQREKVRRSRGEDADAGGNGKEPDLWNEPIEALTATSLPSSAEQGHLPLCALRLHWAIGYQLPPGRCGDHATQSCSSSSSSSSLSPQYDLAAKKVPGAGWLHYDQRRQYMNFLKSCGVTVSDTVRILRSAFDRSHAANTASGATLSEVSSSSSSSSSSSGLGGSADIGSVLVRPKKRWDKYEYDIRYHYGHRGKRETAKTFTCGQLAGDYFKPKPADPQVVGGCPFVHLAPAALSASLVASGLSVEDAEAISAASVATDEDNLSHRQHSASRNDSRMTSSSSSSSSIASTNYRALDGLAGTSTLRRATTLCRYHFDLLHARLGNAASVDNCSELPGRQRSAQQALSVPTLAEIMGIASAASDSGIRNDIYGERSQPLKQQLLQTQQRLGARMLPVQWSAASIRLHGRMKERHVLEAEQTTAVVLSCSDSDEEGSMDGESTGRGGIYTTDGDKRRRYGGDSSSGLWVKE